MLVTVEDGRAVKVHGDPDHPPTHGALCTKVSRYAERTYHAERVLQPLRRVGPKGSGRFERGELGRGAGRHRRPPGARSPGPTAPHEAIVPYSYAGTMGMVQGESMAARFFNKLGASLLDRTICSSRRRRRAGRDLRRQGRHARRALRREQADRHLGQQLDHLEPALLDHRAAGQARRRQADLHRPAPHRDGREVPPAHRAPARHRRRARARRDARADRQRLARPRLHRAPRRRLAGAARARARSGRPSAPPRSAASTPTQVRALARDYGTTSPAAIRLNYGMQRVRGGGNAARLIAILPCLVGAWRHRAGGLLLSGSGWFREGAQRTPRCSAPTCSPAGARAPST